VLFEFADKPDPRDRTAKLRLSYRAMQRYVGVGSPRAVAKALEELEEIGWLQRAERPAAGPVGQTASYLLTPFSDQLQELANSTAADLKTDIRIERELRAERKRKLIDGAHGAASGFRAAAAAEPPEHQKHATKVVAQTRTREGKPPRSFTR
jgi:DNA-binding HxlR family transcriptional regulator